MLSAGKMTIGETSSSFLGILSRNILVVLVFVVGFAGLEVVFELAGGRRAVFVIDCLIAFFGTYYLAERIAVRENLTGGRLPRLNLMAFAGLTMLAGIAIGIGYSLLVIPGLYLMARWSCAFVIIIVDKSQSVTQSMRLSWDATHTSQWMITGFFGLIFIVNLALVVTAEIVLSPFNKSLSLNAGWQQYGVAFLLHASTQWAWSLFSVANLAVFARLAGAHQQVKSVFA